MFVLLLLSGPSCAFAGWAPNITRWPKTQLWSSDDRTRCPRWVWSTQRPLCKHKHTCRNTHMHAASIAVFWFVGQRRRHSDDNNKKETLIINSKETLSLNSLQLWLNPDYKTLATFMSNSMCRETWLHGAHRQNSVFLVYRYSWTAWTLKRRLIKGLSLVLGGLDVTRVGLLGR